METVKIDEFTFEYDDEMECICDLKRKKLIFTNDTHIPLYLTVIIKNGTIKMLPDGVWALSITQLKPNYYSIEVGELK